MILAPPLSSISINCNMLLLNAQLLSSFDILLNCVADFCRQFVCGKVPKMEIMTVGMS